MRALAAAVVAGLAAERTGYCLRHPRPWSWSHADTAVSRERHAWTCSIRGGPLTAALGLGLHFAIAIAMAGAFVVLSWFIPTLSQSPILSGALYLLCVVFASH